jgi:hypothetical protein
MRVSLADPRCGRPSEMTAAESSREYPFGTSQGPSRRQGTGVTFRICPYMRPLLLRSERFMSCFLVRIKRPMTAATEPIFGRILRHHCIILNMGNWNVVDAPVFTRIMTTDGVPRTLLAGESRGAQVCFSSPYPRLNVTRRSESGSSSRSWAISWLC